MATPTHPGRNDRCPCGSGKKYKHCCLDKDEAAARDARAKAIKAAEDAAPAEAPEPGTGEANRSAPTQARHATAQPWKGNKSTRALPKVSTPRRSGGS